ncbi:MAG TPA: bifunctional adenosylcobinamide kinase/adenosylcobinamide-phosphate guanylyltransferase [Planococcus sp. (in: firmicutes)]|nr:bifunctional adenosylcobinamide kinase/adenosylcobinamide-phosphate guanylyltransferase [Planococcus sp. (in: firmicutes)]
MANGEMIFISGGVRSGKSAYAEQLLLNTESPRRIYLASGQAHDSEMAERILRHQQDRKGEGWLTIEQPLHMEQALQKLKKGDSVLWDCATTWLANELYDGWQTGNPCANQTGCMELKWATLQHTIRSIRKSAEMLVVVSNEVMDDFVRDETYQRWLGEIHCWLASECDEAIEMENGAAFKRK